MFSAFNPSKCTHTWSSGQPTLRRPGSSALLKGLTSVVDNSCRSRDSNPQPRVTSPTLYPIGHDSPSPKLVLLALPQKCVVGCFFSYGHFYVLFYVVSLFILQKKKRQLFSLSYEGYIKLSWTLFNVPSSFICTIILMLSNVLYPLGLKLKTWTFDYFFLTKQTNYYVKIN